MIRNFNPFLMNWVQFIKEGFILKHKKCLPEVLILGGWNSQEVPIAFTVDVQYSYKQADH